MVEAGPLTGGQTAGHRGDHRGPCTRSIMGLQTLLCYTTQVAIELLYISTIGRLPDREAVTTERYQSALQLLINVSSKAIKQSR